MASPFPNILIAPLNWGLGHATRCMPLINALMNRGVSPVLASDGAALALLREEYPSLKTLSLPAYDIRYSGNNMILTMGGQLPKIAKAILAEKRAIKKIVRDHQIDILISDNRYGLFHPGCHSIFMTHQLNIKIPNRILEKIVASVNHRLISRFNECWVPDYAVAPRLAGSLSENPNLAMVKYTEPLSRMKKEVLPIKYRMAIVLSGPEPQRTNLEKILLEQLVNFSDKVCFVRGVVNDATPPMIENQNLTILNYLTTDKLNQVLNKSEIVVCRSGYSSLMDLVKLGKRAILIPTPGQTEQEYLAEYLSEIGGYVAAEQEDFELKKALFLLNETTTKTWPEKDGLGNLLDSLLENR